MQTIQGHFTNKLDCIKQMKDTKRKTPCMQVMERNNRRNNRTQIIPIASIEHF